MDNLKWKSTVRKYFLRRNRRFNRTASSLVVVSMQKNNSSLRAAPRVRALHSMISKEPSDQAKLLSRKRHSRQLPKKLRRRWKGWFANGVRHMMRMKIIGGTSSCLQRSSYSCIKDLQKKASSRTHSNFLMVQSIDSSILTNRDW